MNLVARHSSEEPIFITARFSNLSIFYIIFYHSEYDVLNIVINQLQNDVICINNYVNKLSFSCCSEFNLYPKFPSQAGNFRNNPHTSSWNKPKLSHPLQHQPISFSYKWQSLWLMPTTSMVLQQMSLSNCTSLPATSPGLQAMLTSST